MRKLSLICSAALLAVIVSLTGGCASGPQKGNSIVKYRQTTQPNLVIQFYQWDAFYVISPNYRDNGFQRIFKKDSMGDLFERKDIGRDLAVIVVGQWYQGNDLTKIVSDWKDVLSAQGFHRVVWLRGGSADKLPGLTVLDDSRLGPIATAGL